MILVLFLSFVQLAAPSPLTILNPATGREVLRTGPELENPWASRSEEGSGGDEKEVSANTHFSPTS